MHSKISKLLAALLALAIMLNVIITATITDGAVLEAGNTSQGEYSEGDSEISPMCDDDYIEESEY